jgi:predicted metal-dependent hydrolase
MLETSAHKALRRRIASWASRLNLRPKTVRFRSMCAKWGTCSYGGTVTLAVDLVDQEPRFQDFVIVHELVHLKVASHGRAFNERMSAHLPGWQDMEALRKRKPATCRTKRFRTRRSSVKRSRGSRVRRAWARRRLHKRISRRARWRSSTRA